MAKTTYTPSISTPACHVGYKQAFNGMTLLPNGVMKGQAGSSPMYKVKVIWRVYDKQAPENALQQQADVTLFGSRYDWLASNLGQYDTVFVTGLPKFKATVGNNGQAYPQLDIDGHVELLSKYQANANNQTGAQQAAPAAQSYQQPAQQYQQPVQQPAQQHKAQQPQNYPPPQQNQPAPQQNDDLPF